MRVTLYFEALIPTRNICISWPLSIKFGAEEPYSQTPSVNVPPPRW